MNTQFKNMWYNVELDNVLSINENRVSLLLAIHLNEIGLVLKLLKKRFFTFSGDI